MVRRTLELKDLAPNQDYGVQVRATKDAQDSSPSEWSLTLNFTTTSTDTNNNAPTSLVLSIKNDNFIATWTAPTDGQGNRVENFKDYEVTITNLADSSTVVYYTTNERFVFSPRLNETVFGTVATGVPGAEEALASNLEFSVRARDLSDNLSSAITDQITNGALGSFTVTDLESDSPLTVALDWTVPSGGDVLTYIVKWGVASGVYTNESGAAVSKTTLSTVPRGQYYFTVFAYDKYGNETQASNEVLVTVKGFWESDFAIPDAPTISNVTTTFDDTTQSAGINFDVTGPSTADAGAITNFDFHTKYNVRWSEVVDGPFEYQVIEENDNTGTYNVALLGLLPSTTYYIGVQSISEYGQQGLWQTTSQLTAADVTPPSAPTGLSATGSLNNITVSWDANSESDLKYYELWAKQTSDFGNLADPTIDGTKVYTGNGTGFAHAVGSGETWYYSVRAFDLSLNSSAFPASSANATSTTVGGGGGDFTPPTDPSGLSVTPTTYYHGSSERSYVDIAWTASTDETALSYYIISYSVDSQVTWNELTAGPNETDYRILGLEPGVQVDVRLRAVDAGGNQSAWSAIASATPTNTDGDIQEEVAITATGAIQSANFLAPDYGFRIDSDSIEIYGSGTSDDVSLIVGENGLNMNTATGYLWFGDPTEAGAGFSASGTGNVRIGTATGDSVKINGSTGSIYGGASDFAGTGAKWSLLQDGSANFSNVTITADDAGAVDKIVMNVDGNFLVRGNLSVESYTVEMSGDMAITGSLDVNNGSITTTGGNIVVGATTGDTGVIKSNNFVTGTSGFQLDAAGTLEAIDATLDSLTVSGSSLFGGTINTTGTIQSASAGWWIYSNGTARFDDVEVNGGTFSVGGQFLVTSSGVLSASGASITGTLESGSVVSNSSIQSGTIDIGSTDGFHVDSFDRMFVGASTYAGAPFRVSATGDLVANNATLTGSFETDANGNRIVISNIGSDGYLRFYDSLGAIGGETRYDASTGGYRFTSEGGVFIRASGGDVTLETNAFNGDVRLLAGESGRIKMVEDGNTIWNTYRSGDLAVLQGYESNDWMEYNGQDETWKFVIDANTLLLMGNTSFIAPRVHAESSGNGSELDVRVSQNGKLYSVSSAIDDKTNIRYETKPLGILDIDPVYFNYWINDEETGEKKADKITRFGFVAEDIEEVAPGLISYDEDGKVANYYSRGLVAALLLEVKENRARIEALERKLK